MKNGALKIILSAVLIALIIFSAALYVFDIINNGTDFGENLFKMLAAEAICISSLIKILFGGERRKPLEFYASRYKEEIGDAFSASPAKKKKLLSAIRLYNEGDYEKAMTQLGNMKSQCERRADVHAVGLFLALTLTDAGYAEDAIIIYKQMIEMHAVSSTVYGNLGQLYAALGNRDDAIANTMLSIQNDENNHTAYHNLASLYFDDRDLENAKKYAKRALELNSKFRQSATLLAVIYSMEDDHENAEKYSHLALRCGEKPETLKKAIEHYKASRDIADSLDEDDGEDFGEDE